MADKVEYTEITEGAADIISIAAKIVQLKKAAKDASAAADKHMQDLKPLIQANSARYKTSTLKAGLFRFTKVDRVTRTVKADMLLAKGVAADVIADCTTETPSTSITVKHVDAGEE